MILDVVFEQSAHSKEKRGRGDGLVDVDINELTVNVENIFSHPISFVDADEIFFSLHALTQQCIQFYEEKVQVTAKRAQDIYLKTRLQNNLEWKMQRQVRSFYCKFQFFVLPILSYFHSYKFTFHRCGLLVPPRMRFTHMLVVNLNENGNQN